MDTYINDNSLKDIEFIKYLYDILYNLDCSKMIYYDNFMTNGSSAYFLEPQILEKFGSHFAWSKYYVNELNKLLKYSCFHLEFCVDSKRRYSYKFIPSPYLLSLRTKAIKLCIEGKPFYKYIVYRNQIINIYLMRTKHIKFIDIPNELMFILFDYFINK